MEFFIDYAMFFESDDNRTNAFSSSSSYDFFRKDSVPKDEKISVKRVNDIRRT